MNLWKNKFDVIRITKAVRLALGARIVVNAGTASEATVDLTEIGVLDGATSANTGTNKAAILGTSGALTLPGLLTATLGALFGAANTYASVTSITAFATGGQASATALTGETNEITVCATAGDSVKLPVAALGKRVTVINSASLAADVFGQTGAAIDGGSANAAVRLAPGMRVTYEGLSATAWKSTSESSASAANLVTQGTSVSTGVTLDKTKGIITTFSQSAIAAASSTFTVTCNKATTASNIKAYIIDYAGTFTTNGIPVVAVDNRAAGAFDIVVSNAHGANALSGVLKIGFDIVN